jgi:hypothetical protein
VKPKPKYIPEYIGGDLGRIFYTGGSKPKNRVIYLYRLYRVIPDSEKSGARERIRKELSNESLDKCDYDHVRRLSEAMRDSNDSHEWGPVQWATHFVFVAAEILEQQGKPPARAILKDLATKLWAEHQINQRPGSQYTINCFNLTESDRLNLDKELKNLPTVVWAHVWKNTGF